MNLAESRERVCKPPLAQGEEKVRVTAVLLCFDRRGVAPESPCRSSCGVPRWSY